MMRKCSTPTFKAQVIQELLKEDKTLAQRAAEYGVHPTQLIKWRATALDGLPSLFARQDGSVKTENAIGPWHAFAYDVATLISPTRSVAPRTPRPTAPETAAGAQQAGSFRSLEYGHADGRAVRRGRSRSGRH